MSKKEICENNASIAYYSGFGGLEVKLIEHGINDVMYLISGAWTKHKSYHRLKIHYGDKDSYILFHGYRCSLSDFIRM